MYLIAAAVLLWMSLFRFVSTSRRMIETEDSMRFLTFPFIACLAAALVSAPVLSTVIIAQKGAVNPNDNMPNISVWLCLVGGIMLVCEALYRGISTWKKDGNIGFWPIGSVVIPLALSTIAIIAAVKHIQFADQNSGVVAIGMLQEDVEDMSCSSQQMLINWDQSATQPVKYRCPEGLVFNALSHAPFIPWPNYEQGVSQDLSNVLFELINSATPVTKDE